MRVQSFSPVLLTLPLLSTASTLRYDLKRRDLAITTNLPASWSYSGCFADSATNRQLAGASYTDATGMTQEACVAYCDGNGYRYAGLEWSSECYCSNAPGSALTQQPGYECGSGCSGNAAQACGGGQRLTVFIKAATAPTIAPAPNGWAYLGCYTDLASPRTLPYQVAVSGALTVPACTSACAAAGYVMAGVEYSNECFCGNQLSNRAAQAAGTCTMPCTGDITTQCGGGFRLNVYQVAEAPGPIPDGCAALTNNCYTDSIDSRTLPVKLTVEPNALTVGRCLQACVGQGYRYGGVEYGNECFCGNSLAASGIPAPEGQAGCNMRCSGSSAEICGGQNRVSLYQCRVSTAKLAVRDPQRFRFPPRPIRSTSTRSTTTTTIRSTSATVVQPTSASIASTQSTLTSSTQSTLTTPLSPSSTTTTPLTSTTTIVATTTTPPLTTTPTSTLTTSLTTTTTTTSSCVTTPTDYGLTPNGGFDNGLDRWGAYQRDTVGNDAAGNAAVTDIALSNCNAGIFSPTLTQGTRRLTIDYVLPSLTYGYDMRLKFSLGRPGDVPPPTFNVPNITVYVSTQQVFTNFLCDQSDRCNIQGPQGSRWMNVDTTFLLRADLPQGILQVRFVIFYPEGVDNRALLLDDLSLTYVNGPPVFTTTTTTSTSATSTTSTTTTTTTSTCRPTAASYGQISNGGFEGNTIFTGLVDWSTNAVNGTWQFNPLDQYAIEGCTVASILNIAGSDTVNQATLYHQLQSVTEGATYRLRFSLGDVGNDPVPNGPLIRVLLASQVIVSTTFCDQVNRCTTPGPSGSSWRTVEVTFVVQNGLFSGGAGLGLTFEFTTIAGVTNPGIFLDDVEFDLVGGSPV